MIGDEKQLAPISIIADNHLKIENELLNSIEMYDLSESLFERLLRICIKNNYPAYALLNTQSRMSQQIMDLANFLFYNNQLFINPKINFDYKIKLFNSDNDCFFIDTPVEENGKINHKQIEIILQIVNDIKQSYLSEYQHDITPSTIGIISPWRLQCNAIMNALSEEDRDRITVDTVERFQGSERDIIIYCIPANSMYLLDILSKTKIIDDTFVDRKLNVAITRAKRKFIMLGNSEVLEKNDIYKQLIILLAHI